MCLPTGKYSTTLRTDTDCKNIYVTNAKIFQATSRATWRRARRRRDRPRAWSRRCRTWRRLTSRRCRPPHRPSAGTWTTPAWTSSWREPPPWQGCSQLWWDPWGFLIETRELIEISYFLPKFNWTSPPIVVGRLFSTLNRYSKLIISRYLLNQILFFTVMWSEP